MSDIKKVVLAYSGGLDTSVILKWLQDTYQCEVVTFTADLGQGEELEPARAKALLFGIKPEQIYIDDLREEFVRDFVFPMFRANTVYEGEYLLGTSIARPLIAKRLIEIVNETGADAICHGATGKGNDQVRFEMRCGSRFRSPGTSAAAPETSTRRRTPVPAIASTSARVDATTASAATAVFARGPIALRTASIPTSASRIPPGSRGSATISCPAARACVAISLPMAPVAPKMAIRITASVPARGRSRAHGPTAAATSIPSLTL